jgi:hypothetical protein
LTEADFNFSSFAESECKRTPPCALGGLKVFAFFGNEVQKSTNGVLAALKAGGLEALLSNSATVASRDEFIARLPAES